MDRNQQIQQRFADWQKANKMPANLFPKNFLQWVHKAIKFHSPAGLKMVVPDYTKIVRAKNVNEFTIWDLGAIFHILEIRLQDELEMTPTEYCDFQEAIYTLIMEWRKRVTPQHEKLRKEMEEELRVEHEKLKVEQAAHQKENGGKVIEMPVVVEA